MAEEEPIPRPLASDLDNGSVAAGEVSDRAGEDAALALLQQPELVPEIIENLMKSSSAMQSRKVKLAVAAHAKTPRHVSLPLIRQLFTFDLMKLALLPAVAADVKKAADQALIHRLASVTLGEKISLARRASGRVAGALLRDGDRRVVSIALENDRLTESLVIEAISRPGSTAEMVALICRNAKWSSRREVRAALLRNEDMPMEQAIEFARSFSAEQLQEILAGSRLPANIREFLGQDLAQPTALPPEPPEPS